MTLRECMALLLLYRDCRDADVRNQARALVPFLDEAMDVLADMIDEEADAADEAETNVP